VFSHIPGLQAHADDKRVSKLRNAAVSSKTAAEAERKQLGRKGLLPWTTDYFLQTLPYIKSSDFILVPVAHLFLHGLMKTLLKHALLSKEIAGHPVIFTSEQRKAVQVRATEMFCSCSCWI
jgi:hypothetical protein